MCLLVKFLLKIVFYSNILSIFLLPVVILLLSTVVGVPNALSVYLFFVFLKKKSGSVFYCSWTKTWPLHIVLQTSNSYFVYSVIKIDVDPIRDVKEKVKNVDAYGASVLKIRIDICLQWFLDLKL